VLLNRRPWLTKAIHERSNTRMVQPAERNHGQPGNSHAIGTLPVQLPPPSLPCDPPSAHPGCWNRLPGPVTSTSSSS